MLGAVISFVPKALAFLAILVIGWIVAAILRRVVSKVLSKVGLDRLAERGGVQKYTGKFTISQLTGTLVYFGIWLVTLQMAFGAFGQNPISDMINGLVAWLPHLFIAGVIMVVAFAIATMVSELIGGALSATSYGRVLARAAQVFIIAVGAIAALNQIGIATTVTTPILITGLAMVAGTVIVGVGGGLIGPMRQRWERMLGAAESEATTLRGQRSDGGERRSGDFSQPAYSSGQFSQTNADTQAPQTQAGQRRETLASDQPHTGQAPVHDPQDTQRRFQDRPPYPTET